MEITKLTLKNLVYLITDTTRFPRLDIAFVVSATAVAADDNFKLIRSTIGSIIKEHGVRKHLYALVVFGQYASIIQIFQKTEEETLISLVQGAQLPSGAPELVGALETTKQLFFDPSGGARPDSRKIVVIMIDRKSVNTKSGIEKVAGEYEDNKVKFVTVVVGAEADPSELGPLTPDKKNDSIVPTDKNDDPSKVAKDIWDMMGLGIYNCKENSKSHSEFQGLQRTLFIQLMYPWFFTLPCFHQ